jgi:cytochrome c biogenesis protein CcmG/thiol:disulfide interchange protein DsbE
MLTGGVAAAVAIFTLPLAFGLTRDPNVTRSPLLGKAAPPFTLTRLNGEGRLSLQELRGHVVVLNFWASWCVECRVEHDALAAAWARFRDQGVVLVGVSFQDPPSAARGFVRATGADWPQVQDPGTRTALAYGVSGVPETFLIGPDGRIAYRWIGPVSYDALAERVDRLVGGTS